MEHSSASLTQLIDWFDVGALVEGATKHKCRSAFKQLVQIVGDIKADDLSVPQVGQFQLTMKQDGLSVATVRSYFASASEVYSWGVSNAVVLANPFAVARKMRPVKREVAVLSAEDLKDFCCAAAEKARRDPTARLRWFLILEIAATSGLRSGEIQNLRWDDVDLDAGVLHVCYRPDAYMRHWEWGTKGKTDREVPVSQAALDGLHRLKEIATWRYPLLKKVTCDRHLGSIFPCRHQRQIIPAALFSNLAGPAYVSPTSSVLSGRAGIYQDTYLNKGLCGVGSHRRAPLTFPGQFLCEACKRRRVTLGTSRAWYTKAGLRGARLYQGRKG